MKKYFIPFLLFSFTLFSCNEEEVYPKYSLIHIDYIPDSLKLQHRLYIIELTRAASQHMSGGDYEDVDRTIRQAESTARNLFSVKILSLRKHLDEHYYNDVELKPTEFTKREQQIFDALTQYKQ